MLPSVALAESIEMLRDGGSLCAAFQGSNGSHYWLVLRIKLGAGGMLQPLGYEQPIVVERPGVEELQISWAHAEILLRQVERLLPPEADRKWVEPMYRCIARQGSWHARV